MRAWVLVCGQERCTCRLMIIVATVLHHTIPRVAYRKLKTKILLSCFKIFIHRAWFATWTIFSFLILYVITKKTNVSTRISKCFLQKQHSILLENQICFLKQQIWRKSKTTRLRSAKAMLMVIRVGQLHLRVKTTFFPIQRSYSPPKRREF